MEEPRSALGQVDSDSMIASAAPLQGAPTRGLLEKSVSGTNWSGKVYDYAPDWDNCDIGLDVDVWKLRFNMAVTLAVKAKFDITTTGASRGREKVEVANINIDLKYGFSLNLKYEFVAQFDDTPVHVAGEMGSKITLSFGLSPASLRNFETPVTFTTFEVGRNGQYFADAAYANKDINLYIGAQFTGSVYFLYFNLDLWFYEITIGPLIALNLEFKSGVDEAIIQETLRVRYGVLTSAIMTAPHDYLSIPGKGEAIYRTRELVASVINYKPQEGDPTGEHTIGGVKYWSTSSVYDSLPEYITLQVWEVRDDGTKAKVGEPFRLNNSHGAHSNDVERLMWPWTFTHASIDPSKTYTVTEEMPSDFADKDKYFSRVFGLNLSNLRAEGTSPKLRFVKAWDKAYRPYKNQWPYVEVDMYDPAGTSIVHVELGETGYEAIVPLPEGVTRNKMEAGEYTITEQVRTYNGSTLSSFIFNWSGPEVSVDGDRNPVYTYYLSNTVQDSMYFDLEKEWKMDANPQAASSSKPREVHVQLYRDGEIIRDAVLNDDNHWKIERYGGDSIPKASWRKSWTPRKMRCTRSCWKKCSSIPRKSVSSTTRTTRISPRMAMMTIRRMKRLPWFTRCPSIPRCCRGKWTSTTPNIT